MGTHAERQEQQLLLGSAAAVLLLSVVGVVVGLWAGAKSIVFDGMYGVVDAGMTFTAWFAARLIAGGNDRRFQYGYWHLEPMLAFLNGAMLLVACVYGVVDGVGTLLAGGRAVRFAVPVVYAAAVAVLSFAAYAYVRRKGRGLESTLLKLNARAWLLGGILSAGLCASFALVGLLQGAGAGRFAPFVDPAILIVLAACMAPLPVMTLIRAGREVLQIAPPDLDARVHQIAGEQAARHGFVEHQSHVMRLGRAQFVEIGFVGPSAATTKTLGELDAIRQEIADAMGGLRPGYWLTVHFTADPRYIEHANCIESRSPRDMENNDETRSNLSGRSAGAL